MKAQREGTKQSPLKGASAIVDREPLFPRLHVNETEKAGPKAPPRNKMALYEQFTVPSHRFLQINQASLATPFHQMYGSGYPYIPYYVPSVHHTSHSKNAQVRSQIAQVSDSSKESEIGSDSKISKALAEASAIHVIHNQSEQETREAKQHTRASYIKNVTEPVDCQENASSVVEKLLGSGTTESLNEEINISEEGIEIVHKKHDHDRDHVLKNDSGQLRVTISSVSNTSATMLKQEEGGVMSKFHSSTSQCLTSHQDQHSMQSDTSIEPKNSDESTASLLTENQSMLSFEGAGEGCPDAGCESSRAQLHCHPVASSDPEMKDGDQNKGGPFGKLTTRSSIVAENVEGKELEVSDPVGDADNELECMLMIRPKDVIHVIGQQQFWKARRTLLRQQRTFSDQVFQLHKLVSIQHLLAETAGVLIDESVEFETVDSDPACPSTKRTLKSSDSVHNQNEESKLSKRQKKGLESPPAVSKDAKNEERVSMAGLIGDEVSAWGYPSFGQWIDPMAAHCQPYDYRSMSASFPVAPAFGFPYGSASPMFSFGIPYYGQIPELPPERHPNSGHTSNHEGGVSESCNFGQISNEREGLQSSTQPIEISTPMPTRRKSSMTHSKSSPSVAKRPEFSGKEVEGVLKNSYMDDGHCPDYEVTEERDVHPRPIKKAYKVVGCPPVDEGLVGVNVHSSDVGNCVLDLFPLVPSLSPIYHTRKLDSKDPESRQGQVIRAVPRRDVAASDSAAGILLSLQRDRQK
ncbi:hypothetical protein KP509_08G069300 [Ceratopteris richardii]|uniref:ELF3-like protein 2 n=1 Tax=Ceratopteris richardii TaxID=49495 RepID=A0A8T2UD86_CERRI|nr:hypothetical protein KP509_08G069300 [Ceratopteris richardii]